MMLFLLFKFFPPLIFTVHITFFFSFPLMTFDIWSRRPMFPINHSQTFLGAPVLLPRVSACREEVLHSTHLNVDLLTTLSTQTQSQSVREGKDTLLGWALNSGRDGTRFGLSSSPTPTPLSLSMGDTGLLALIFLICFPIPLCTIHLARSRCL